MSRKSYTLVCLMVSLAFTTVWAQEDLLNLVKGRDVVRVYVSEVSKEAGLEGLSPEEFTAYLKKAIRTRKVTNFQLVKEAKQAEIEIRAKLIGYEYSEKDPITSFGSPQTFALDALTHENYAAIEVEFTALDPRNGQTLWSDEVSAFAKGEMTVEESKPIVYDKVSRRFLWKCFGRPSELRGR